MGNKDLHKAAKAKKDDFYTQLPVIEKELKYHKSQFKDKVVYCNCDDPHVSNFFHYFSYKFEELGLKKLISSCYKNQNMDLFSQNDAEQAIYLEYEGDKNENRIPDPEEYDKKGVYFYVLTRDKKLLNLRQFDDSQRLEAYERQKGICKKCGEYFELDGMEADHITPWHLGGKTIADNCQMLCKDCNRDSTAKRSILEN